MATAGFADGYPNAPTQQLDPRAVVRAAVLIQSAARRFLVEDCRDILQISPTVPAPPVAVALEFCRRLRHVTARSFAHVEQEALGVAAVICGKEHGITLGPIASAYEEYAPVLGHDHPVIQLLVERFDEVSLDAEDEMLTKIDSVSLPSEARQIIADVSVAWGAPREHIAGGELFAKAWASIEGLKAFAESFLTERLGLCQTQVGFNTLTADIDLEFTNCHTVLRQRVRTAKKCHRELIELAVTGSYGWPPTGKPLPLAMAARWYAVELGADHPSVDDFIAAARRVLNRTEKAAAQELAPHVRVVVELRRRLNVQPPPPKLIREALTQELDEYMNQTALAEVERLQQELGFESPLVLQHISAILGSGAYLERCEAQAAEAATELRQPDPGPYSGPSGAELAEARMAAAARLCQILDVLEAERSPNCIALRAEFFSDLEQVRPLVAYLRPDRPGSLAPLDGAAGGDVAGEESDDDGWHRPPDFNHINDRPLAAPEEPQHQWQPPAEDHGFPQDWNAHMPLVEQFA